MPHEWHRDGFTISTDHSRLDLDAVYEFLSTSYWARGIPRDVMERSIAHAVPFGIYEGCDTGGIRARGDRPRHRGYLGDVFVLEPWRGRGLSRWLMECMLAHPELQGFRRWFLLTRDAHGCTRSTASRRWRPRTGGWRSTRSDPYGTSG
jgi:GNAT superfamily N-acetyltransferase